MSLCPLLEERTEAQRHQVICQRLLIQEYIFELRNRPKSPDTRSIDGSMVYI